MFRESYVIAWSRLSVSCNYCWYVSSSAVPPDMALCCRPLLPFADYRTSSVKPRSNAVAFSSCTSQTKTNSDAFKHKKHLSSVRYQGLFNSKTYWAGVPLDYRPVILLGSITLLQGTVSWNFHWAGWGSGRSLWSCRSWKLGLRHAVVFVAATMVERSKVRARNHNHIRVLEVMVTNH